MNSNYDGVLERWKVDLAVQRARRMGFRGQDLDDAMQEVAVALIGFTYNEARSNGATQSTAVTAVIDNVLRTIRRKECRHQQRLARYGEEHGIAETYEPTTATEIDVQNALGQLSPLQRRICQALSEGRSLNEVAALVGKSWCAIRDQAFQIRRHFETLGLGNIPVPHQEGAAA